MPKQILPPTQQFLEIEEIRNGTIILKNKNLRAILMCSSINFELKSAQEQEAVIYQYQNFLNSLDFYIQYLIYSRRLNIENYIKTLEEREQQQENELLRVQTQEYITFIRGFVDLQNIMSKHFYVAIPYDSAIISQEGFVEKVTSIFSKAPQAPQSPSVLSDEEFLRRKTQLWQRVNNVIAGLQTVGVKAVPLNDEELYELFYNAYNPGEKAPAIDKQL